MLVSLFVVLLIVSVMGLLTAEQAALLATRRSRLQSDIGEGVFGAEAAISLLDKLDESVACNRAAVCLLAVGAAFFSATTIVPTVALSGVAQGLSPSTAFSLAYVASGGVLGFVFVVLGDLLPTKLAERNPELVARLIAPFASLVYMAVRPCARFASRFVSVLVPSTTIERVSDEDVEEDIKSLVDEGQRAGVIEAGEKEIINRVFKLDDKPVVSLMTPRADVVMLKTGCDLSTIIREAAESKHTWFPVQGDGEEDVLGIVSVHDLLHLERSPQKFPQGLADLLVEPLEVPESMSALKLLELFRSGSARFAVVRDEHGAIAGIITVYDVLQVIVGDIGEGVPEQRRIFQRDDGSFLVDAGTDIRDLFEVLEISDESPFEAGEFHSLGGYVMTTLGSVPTEGARFEAYGFSFEVIDMDNKRIDKVLVTRSAQRKAAGI
jgi:putative hemolysin